MISGTTILCCLCAVLFWVCNAIDIIVIAQRSTQWTIEEADYKQLLPNYIVDDWLIKYGTKPLELASGFIKGIFWVIFCLPIIEMAWVLSKGGERNLVLNLGIILFALGGSWTKWLCTIFWNGMYISFHQVAMYFNLERWLNSTLTSGYDIEGEDGIGWRALEVNYISAKGLVWIVDAVEWICLAAIFSLTFVSVFHWRKEDDTSFGAKWNALGLFIGLLAVVEFVLEMLGFKGFFVAWIFVVLYAALNRLILIPVWIIVLGLQLPNANAKAFGMFDEAYDNPSAPELHLSESQQRDSSQFTIDEDDNMQGGQTSEPTSPPTEAFTTN